MLRGIEDRVGEGSRVPGRGGTKVPRCGWSWVPENRGADDQGGICLDDPGCQGAKAQKRESPKEPAIVGSSEPQGSLKDQHGGQRVGLAARYIAAMSQDGQSLAWAPLLTGQSWRLSQRACGATPSQVVASPDELTLHDTRFAPSWVSIIHNL
jgi:hypothetical protein